MTSIQWYVISALKASTSVTSRPLAAGLTGAGRDLESSAQRVSLRCLFRPMSCVMFEKLKNIYLFLHSTLTGRVKSQ